LEESADVSSLNERVEFVQEYPFFAGREDLIPPAFADKLSPDTLRKAAKIVHVRFT
jgi:hypothetical protein